MLRLVHETMKLPNANIFAEHMFVECIKTYASFVCMITQAVCGMWVQSLSVLSAVVFALIAEPGSALLAVRSVEEVHSGLSEHALQ